ncbi:hypothetical protein IDAT_02035 [Pseudidiomarina atlantica]|uniref:CdiI immunity protein domain-containing protein n=1 Tax=Pseudidiomarina atlantica TaxID=1517416 RepID=A0A094IVR2_9GAMM|nr:hypothetical protein [Pseudidiomarina atlantica]KFZ29894.1 hypothetical protein IDAT_02035 [Pseudidiomarina atlantica]
MTESTNEEQYERLWLRISRAFFKSDPMNTGCQENECFDEYERIADAATHYVLEGSSEAQAVRQALEDSFGDWVTDDNVAAVMDYLRA